MELRELLVEVELQIIKARGKFFSDAHNACRDHLLNVHELLHAELPQLMDPPTDEGGAKK